MARNINNDPVIGGSVYFYFFKYKSKYVSNVKRIPTM